MIVSFPYAWAPPLDLTGYNVNGIYAPAEGAAGSRGPTLEEALRKPIGAKPLAEQIRALPSQKRSTVIIVDDLTRNTPLPEILPVLTTELKGAGLLASDIHIIIGTGLHRPMTSKEIETHLGRATASEFIVTNHDAHDAKNLVSVGKSADGVEIKINRRVVEADFLMTVGQIAPHRVAGFSGGAKMIQPAVCDGEITASVHWRGWRMETEAIIGIRDNPIRSEMDLIAKKVGLKFILNAVLNPDESIFGVYGGDFIEAHKKGCQASLGIYAVPVKKADIVIIDSHPCDIDLWQAAKAASPAEMALKPGGAVILVTPCPEKISPNHPEIMEVGYRAMPKILDDFNSGALPSKVFASHLAAFGRILERGRLILVSPGFTPGEVKKMRFEYAATVKDALEKEVNRIGHSASISVLSHGGKIFPKIID